MEEMYSGGCDFFVKDPLNSGDDVSDADPTEVFDAENVIVCQFDKVCLCCLQWTGGYIYYKIVQKIQKTRN